MRWCVVAWIVGTGCAIKFKAIDVKQGGAVSTVPGGGCVDPTLAVSAETAESSFFNVTVKAAELKKQVGDYPADGCIESFSSLKFQVLITDVSPADDCVPEATEARGTIQFKRFVLSTDAQKPARLAVQCANAEASLTAPDDMQRAVQACIDDNLEAVGEWLRQALNAKGEEINLTAKVSCSADACFEIKSMVKARFNDPIVNIAKGCSP